MEKSTFVMDVDGTICVADRYPDESSSFDYQNARPIKPVIRQIRQLKSDGHRIIIHTARGMRTYGGDVEKIRLHVLPVLEEWLARHEVPYDEIHVGKPWGPNVFYVDDKSLSPADFAWHQPEEFESFTIKRFVKP